MDYFLRKLNIFKAKRSNDERKASEVYNLQFKFLNFCDHAFEFTFQACTNNHLIGLYSYCND